MHQRDGQSIVAVSGTLYDVNMEISCTRILGWQRGWSVDWLLLQERVAQFIMAVTRTLYHVHKEEWKISFQRTFFQTIMMGTLQGGRDRPLGQWYHRGRLNLAQLVSDTSLFSSHHSIYLTYTMCWILPPGLPRQTDRQTDRQKLSWRPTHKQTTVYKHPSSSFFPLSPVTLALSMTMSPDQKRKKESDVDNKDETIRDTTERRLQQGYHPCLLFGERKYVRHSANGLRSQAFVVSVRGFENFIRSVHHPCLPFGKPITRHAFP